MNYYPFHLGDYATHTAHLDLIEDLAYRRMLDLYYLRESPLPADIAEVARLIRLRDYQAQVESVLREFFQLTDDGWENARCHAEINAMAEKRAKARASAAASVNARRTNVERTLNERSANVELPTPTPIPKNSPSESKARARATTPKRPQEVPDSVWEDWLELRKRKRAPVTRTVIEEAKREASKAGLTLERFLTIWCARGSQGLQADWLKPEERGQSTASWVESRNRTIAALTGADRKTTEVIDVTANRLD
jgi:uncharacterized protein YdaU (DUF1376 family)